MKGFNRIFLYKRLSYKTKLTVVSLTYTIPFTHDVDQRRTHSL